MTKKCQHPADKLFLKTCAETECQEFTESCAILICDLCKKELRFCKRIGKEDKR
jgi:hypothetical protein